MVPRVLSNEDGRRFMRWAIPLFSILWLASATVSAGTLVPIYGTYFGGTGDINAAVAVALDSFGNLIVAGTTTSQTLPGTANAFQPTKAVGLPDNQDVFVSKFDATGRKLLLTTFLGGDSDDTPIAISVDKAGSIYIVGFTQSSNFPVSAGAFQAPSAGDSFVAKISADGSALIYSTGLTSARATALSINDSGEAYVTGGFTPFPSTVLVTPGAVNLGNGLSVFSCIFLVRLNSTGTGLIFGSNLGGGDGLNGSLPSSIAVDLAGNIYVAGKTLVDSVPTTPDALQVTFSNDGLSAAPNVYNGFILKVNAIGTQILYGTYFGPRYASTTVTNFEVTPAGSIYFAGATNATSFQSTSGAYLNTPGGGFIAEFTPGSATLSAFTYLYGPPATACGTLFATCTSGLMAISTQSLYAVAPASDSSNQLLELNQTNFAVTSSGSLQTFGASAFSPQGISVASPSSIWVVGLCGPCSIGSPISTDAFQSSPVSISQNAVLMQMTDISPTVSFVASAATGSSPFAAAQIVSIYGSQLGLPAGSGLQLGPGGVVTTTSGGTQVLFGGTAAPILYAGDGQVNAVIPCEVAGQSSIQMVVDYMGAQSAPVTLALGPAAPGIFTADGSGQGQAAALNQDNSFNSPSNPAPRGSIVTFYATGVGPTSPCVDGQVYTSNFPTIPLPVVVGVGSSGAHVDYAGQAPDLVSGVAQFNIEISSDATTGVVPLTLVVGGVFSTPGVTIAVK
jgi:uncharacterized protein (TIGR03437 family)